MEYERHTLCTIPETTSRTVLHFTSVRCTFIPRANNKMLYNKHIYWFYILNWEPLIITDWFRSPTRLNITRDLETRLNSNQIIGLLRFTMSGNFYSNRHFFGTNFGIILLLLLLFCVQDGMKNPYLIIIIIK